MDFFSIKIKIIIYYNYEIGRIEVIDVYNPLLSKNDMDYIENKLRRYNIYK